MREIHGKWRKKNRQNNFYGYSADAALSIMHKKTFFNFWPWAAKALLPCNHYILGYSDAVQLQRRSAAAVMILV